MKTSFIAIIVGVAIASMLAGIFGYQKIYESRCLEEGGTMTSFLSCTVVFMDFASDPNAELKQKMQELIAEEKNNPTRPGHSYVRIAIDSDELTFDEKLQVLEIYYNEESTGESTFDNVMTGKERFEYQEPITFTWKQFGWGFPCPRISIQDELQVDQYNREVLYQERIVYPCPYSDGNSAFLFTFTEENLPDFPPCTISGKHVISVKDQFDQWFPLHEYWCNSGSNPEHESKTIVETKPNFSYAKAVKIVRNDLESHNLESEKISFVPVNHLFYTATNGTVFPVKTPYYTLDSACPSGYSEYGPLICGYLNPSKVDSTRGKLVHLITAEYKLDNGFTSYHYLVDAKTGEIISGFFD